MNSLFPLLIFSLVVAVVIYVWCWISRRFWGRDTQIEEARRTNQLLEILIKDQRTLIQLLASNKPRQ